MKSGRVVAGIPMDDGIVIRVLELPSYSQIKQQRYGGCIMIMDIFVGVMIVIAAGAGIWVWWMENGKRN